MLFIRSTTYKSKKSIEELKRNLVGKHLSVHKLDFEVYELEGKVKIIPHAEDDDHIYTLPITSLSLSRSGNETLIKMKSKPRRIDIGGPNLVLIFIFFAIIASIVIYFKTNGEYNNAVYIMLGISALVFGFLWYRMEIGYFDYIRKIRQWVKSNL